MTANIAITTGNRAHLVTERGEDLYQTPAVAVRALLKVEPVPLTVWECACGPGAIVRELRASGRAVIATDLIDYGCPESDVRRDFLMEREAPGGVPAICTNPPFKLAEEFAEHAIRLVPEVYMLMRVGFLAGLRWERGLGEHLARVHIFSPRLPMIHRDGWQGKKTTQSAMDFAWYVFHRDHRRRTRTAPQIGWFNWKKDLGHAA